ncbi:integrase catalytic domain-containing protein [Trichonephila clavipes]|nr:integrase catalytic domain-containing protein [Trichonephila clavipes]
MESITTENVEQTLFAGWISLFGSPEKIATDQGRQFESQLLKHLSKFTAFERSRTTSYHPCTNGMIERVHRQLKAPLMCHTDSFWFEALPVVLLGIRSVFKEDFQSSSAKLVYGPYRILQRIGKVLVLRIDTKEVRGSVDRIKPAYVLADDPPSSGLSLRTPGSARPTVTIRSGRRVNFSDFSSSLNYFSPQGVMWRHYYYLFITCK